MNRLWWRLIVVGAAGLACTHAPAEAADDDILAALNSARTTATCLSGAAPPALRAQPKLDAAAADLAQRIGSVGKPLDEILGAAGYRATRSMYVQTSGVATGAALARLVADRYCAQLVSSEWQDIGLHQRFSGGQVQTWLVLAAPFTAPSADRASEIAARVLELTNLARRHARTCGDKSFAPAVAVKWSERLATTSFRHATDMATHNYFSHDGRDGSKPSGRATRAGYVWRAVGENIAAGQGTADAVVQGWIDSPPHCANLMSDKFTEMGVAYAVNPNSQMGIYWAQVFGTPR
jgi:uncharacterized protein YkwD